MKPPIPLKEMFPGHPDDALDLLDRMLDLNPLTRISVDEALSHPYLEPMHDPEDEPIFEGQMDFSYEEDATLTLEKVKRLILK